MKRDLNAIAMEIAKDILTIWSANPIECTRAQMMFALADGSERDMGGRNKDSIAETILMHLSAISSSTIDQEFAAENSELCIRIAQRDKELAILRDLLARLLCWPVLDDLREGERWKREIADTLHSRMAATLSEPTKEVRNDNS